uniref:Uncharacterized protein n=1 Tax=viral metagenome TaxID=1070528 RepID=A0A6C0BG98_9ZZZZ
MGASKSKQMVETFTKTTNEIMNKTTTNISNQNNMSAVLHQRIDVDLEGANLGNCSLRIVQEGSVTMDVIVDFAAEVGVQMSAEMLNKLEETATQTIEKVRSGFSLPSIDVSSAVHSSRIEIENKVSNIVETSIKNVVEVSAENNQVIVFKGRNMIMGNCVAGQGLDFDQKGQVEVIARSISKNVIDNFMEVKAINDIMRDIQQSEKLEYIGLDVGGILKGFWSTVIMAGVLVLIAIIALLVYLNYNPEVAMAGLDVAKVAIAPQTAFMQNPQPRYQQPQQSQQYLQQPQQSQQLQQPQYLQQSQQPQQYQQYLQQPQQYQHYLQQPQQPQYLQQHQQPQQPQYLQQPQQPQYLQPQQYQQYQQPQQYQQYQQPQYLQQLPPNVTQSLRGGKEEKKGDKPVWPLIVVGVSILLALLCGGLAYYFNNKINEEQAEVDKKNKEIDELNSYRE